MMGGELGDGLRERQGKRPLIRCRCLRSSTMHCRQCSLQTSKWLSTGYKVTD